MLAGKARDRGSAHRTGAPLLHFERESRGERPVYRVGPVLALLAAAFVLTSPSFVAGGPMPKAYTCSGRNVSPALRWTAPPRGTRAFAVTMDDTDAHFRHWVGWGISRFARGTRELRRECLRTSRYS